MTKKIAIIQFSFDGIQTLMGGVGYAVQNTLSAIESINKQQNSIQLTSILVTPQYDPSISEYNIACKNRSLQHCEITNGKLFEIDNNMPLHILGGAEQFAYLSQKGAVLLSDFLAANGMYFDAIKIIFHDFSFSHIPKYYAKLSTNIPAHCQFIWVPHTSARIYYTSLDNLDTFQTAWLNYEKEIVNIINDSKNPTIMLGYINQTMKNEWVLHYAVKAERLIPFKGGITFERFSKKLSSEYIIKTLKKFDIPQNKPLIFSMGRGVSIKGHDQVIHCVEALLSHHPQLHLVLLAPKMQEDPEYPELLTQIINEKNLKNHVTLITTFETELPKVILQHEQTQIIAMFSRDEAFGLVALEARLAPNKAILLVSDRGGMKEIVEHGVDGFVFHYGKRGEEQIDDAINKALHILGLTSEERDSIIQAGHERVSNDFNLVKNFSASLFPEIESSQIIQ